LLRTSGQLTGLFNYGEKINADLYEQLETILISSDVGMAATTVLLADLPPSGKIQHLSEAAQFKQALANCLIKLLKPLQQPLQQPLQANTQQPYVIMLDRRQRRR